MVASDCTFEVDIRLPNGLDAPQILAEIDRIVALPEASYRQIATTRRAGAHPTPRWRSSCAPMPERWPASTRPR